LAAKVQFWTPELLAWLVKSVREQIQASGRVDWNAIAKACGGVPSGCSQSHQREVNAGRAVAVQAQILAHRRGEALPAIQLPTPVLAPPPIIERPLSTIPDIRDHLDIPPRPFNVPLPRRAVQQSGTIRQAIVYGDTHFPYQNEKALAVVLEMIERIQPDIIVHLGDLLDCYPISRFSKDPNRLHSLQDEINLARAHLHQVRQLAPSAECWVLEGNHEDRLRRQIWDLPGGAAELARLTAFQEAMSWPVLLGLAEIDWKWVPSGMQSKTPIIPHLLTKHGTVVRKWAGYTARGEWERYGKGGMSGHTHRLGGFYHRDHNGAVCWWEAGCTCDLDPSYVHDPDWQAGCLVVTWDDEGGVFGVEPIFIHEGSAMFRGDRLAA
jgi:hypothetical protein